MNESRERLDGVSQGGVVTAEAGCDVVDSPELVHNLLLALMLSI